MDPARWKILLGLGATILVLLSVGYEFLEGDVPLAQDGPNRTCTLMGCMSNASVQIQELPRDARIIKLCANGRCETQSAHSLQNYDKISLMLNLPEGSKTQRIAMRLTIRDRKGRRIAGDTLVGYTQPWYANGKACDGEDGACQEIQARFTDGKLTRTYRDD